MERFDKDLFLPHRRFGLEWWYFTGFLNGRFGFEATIFLSESRGLPLSIYFPFVKSILSHFAITDLKEKRFTFNEWTKLIDLSRQDNDRTLLNISAGGVSLMSNGLSYMLSANCAEYSLSLLLNARKPPVAHGENGIIAMGKNSSYYYSITNMSASGIVRKRGEFFEVKGAAWHDHQFGNFTVSGMGWSWFSLRLKNDIEIMAFLLNDKRGNRWKYLTLIMPGGSKKAISDFEIRTLNESKYGTEWQIEFSGGKFVVTSMQEGQFARSKMPFVPEYAEMLSSVKGEIFGKQTEGYAYVEIVKPL